MIDTLTFLNETQFWPIIIGTGVLGCFFIWKEWHHFATTRFWIKMILISVALLALSMIALQPALMVKKKTKSAILLTKDFKTERLDSLKIAHKKIKRLTYEPNVSIFESDTAIDSVFVLGQGIESHDLWQLKTKTVFYLGDALPSGIIKYTYNNKSREGEELLFKGMYNRPIKEHRLILEEPGGMRLDSLKLDDLERQAFQLTAPLKASGKYIYKLIEEDTEGQLISQNPIPVEVKKREVLKIVLINEFPTFESKYLKNYLAEKGHEVVVRSQLTKERFKYEYFNTKKRNIGRFTKSNLKAYDILIIDANALKNIGESSRKALENAVSEDGLGVLIQASTSFSRYTGGLVRFDFIQDGKTNAALQNASKTKIGKHPYSFKPQFTLGTLLQDNTNNVLAAYKRKGIGRVGITVLTTTYELILKGQTKQYQELWSRIIEDLSKRKNTQISWETTTNLATKDYPFLFKLRTLKEEIPDVKIDENYRVALRNSIDLPKVWKGITYSIDSGWHTLKVEQDSSDTFNYYVQDTLSWKTKIAYDKIEENKRLYNNANPKNESVYSLEPINLLWFFSLFLISIGLLWLLPKLLD